MALAESAAADVLPAEANRLALEHQTAERQRFAKRPIDRPAGQRLAPFFHEVLQLGMQMEIRRERVVSPSMTFGGQFGTDGRRRCASRGRRRRRILQFVGFGILLGRIVAFGQPRHVGFLALFEAGLRQATFSRTSR